MEPCGTPVRTLRLGGVVWKYRQAAVHPRKYAVSHLTVLWSREEWPIAEMRRVWSTMSKALERSRDIMAVRRGGLGWLKPVAMRLVRGRSAVVVECCCLKPCWKSDGGRW